MCGGLYVSNLLFVNKSKISNAYDIAVIRGTLPTVYGNESTFPYYGNNTAHAHLNSDIKLGENMAANFDRVNEAILEESWWTCG